MDLLTSIHELSNSRINIFPNPAIDVINIEVEGNLNYMTKLFDLNGKLIQTTVNSSQLKIASLTSGLYLLEIKDLQSSRKIVERIVIGH